MASIKYKNNGTYKYIVVKVGDTLPIGAEIDYEGSIVPNGWEEVDDPNTYSTDEIRIGTYLDKPLYRKVFEITNPSSSNTNYQDLSSYNIDTLVSLKAPIKNSQIGKFVAPYQDSEQNYAILFINTSGYLRGRFGSAVITGFVECKVILEYTKTTD